MKKVLVLTNWYPSKDRPEQYTFVQQQVAVLSRLFPELSGENWKFVVWNVLFPTDLVNVLLREKPKHETWVDGSIPVIVDQPTIISHRLPLDQHGIVISSMRNGFEEVTRTLGGLPDVVWAVTLTSAIRWSQLQDKLKLNIPFLLQEHSNPLAMHLKHRKSVNWARQALHKISDVVVVAERQIAEFKELESHCDPEVIWNCVADEFLHATKGVPPANHFVFLFVGRFSTEKGLRRLLLAAAELKLKGYSFKIRLVGSGPEEMSLRADARDHLLEEHIEWLGVRTPGEISLIMDECHSFVLPSYYENCPVALLEAQAKGLVCVCTVNAGSEKVLLPGNGIAVKDTGQGRELAEALIQALETYSSYSREAIRERSASEFSSAVFGRKMFNLFSKALS